jgi:hypothetical protein
MDKDRFDTHSIDTALDKALADAMNSSPDVVTQTQINRRRWFGLGALVLAVFCMSVAAMPWPGKQPIDLGIWIVFALLMLLVGGGSFYKADKDEARAEKLRQGLRSPKKNSDGPDLRRLK